MSSDTSPQYFGRDLEAMSFAENYHQWIIDEFAPYMGENAAEVGAGTGNFTKLLLNRLESIAAFEPSENMFPLLSAGAGTAAGVDVFNSYFGEAQAGNPRSFDTVFYVNVLEHIEDDLAEAKIMFDALESGGHALIFVPALPWLYSNLDRDVGHFRRYQRKPLGKLFESAGFEIITNRYFDLAGVLPWYVVFVLLKRSISTGKVSTYDRLVVPVTRFLENLVTPPLGKNLLLVARKP